MNGLWVARFKVLDKAPTIAYTSSMPRKPAKLSDQIRALIRSSGLSRYGICKATGIDEGALSHFLAGHRGLSLDSLDKLGQFLGWRIVADKTED